MRASLLFLVAALSACGRPMHPGDPDLYGVDLVVRPDAAPYTRQADFHARLKRVLEVAAAFYGHSPEEFAGLRIDFVGTTVQCGQQSGDVGCNDPPTNTITVATLQPECYVNVESSALPHELLHYFIIDPNHLNPLWRALDPLWWQLHDGVACLAPQDVCGMVCSYSWQWDVGR
jgi:hypothetical protein